MIIVSIDERLMLLKIRSGKTDLFLTFYDRYYPAIYRYVSFKLPSQEVSEDVASEVFTRALEYVTNNQRPMVKNVRAFLYQLARATIADYYRKNSVPTVSLEVTEELEDRGVDISVTETMPFSEYFSDAVAVNDLHRHLLGLSQEQREVVLLRYMEGFSASEIGKIIGKSAGAVRTMLHRAMGELRGKLKE